MYPAARARSGKNTAGRMVRSVAMPRPSASAATAHTTSNRTLSHSPRSTAGSDSRATSGSRKLARNRSQPGAPVTAAYSRTPTTSVDTAATTTDRIVCRRRYASRSSCNGLGLNVIS